MENHRCTWLGLSLVETINIISNRKTHKIIEIAKIFHCKMLTEKILVFLNATEVIIGNDHIINIKKKHNGAFVGMTNEEGRVIGKEAR